MDDCALVSMLKPKKLEKPRGVLPHVMLPALADPPHIVVLWRTEKLASKLVSLRSASTLISRSVSSLPMQIVAFSDQSWLLVTTVHLVFQGRVPRGRKDLGYQK